MVKLEKERERIKYKKNCNYQEKVAKQRFWPRLHIQRHRISVCVLQLTLSASPSEMNFHE